jgi:hypothetical protein
MIKFKFEDTARSLTHDQIGRSLEPMPMPEYLKDSIATCYGLLHGVTTDDKRVHRARRGLLQWLTKDEQARGIDMARGVMTLTDTKIIVNDDGSYEPMPLGWKPPR